MKINIITNIITKRFFLANNNLLKSKKRCTIRRVFLPIRERMHVVM